MPRQRTISMPLAPQSFSDVSAWWPYYKVHGDYLGRVSFLHLVAVRVVSTPRNIFGPFHNRTKPRMRAWPAAWADFPSHQPAGAEYDVLDYGLSSPPVLSIARKVRDHPAGR